MSLPMLQVALDNQTMDSAYETTRLIAEEVDIIEVGTILCVGEGVHSAVAICFPCGSPSALA